MITHTVHDCAKSDVVGACDDRPQHCNDDGCGGNRNDDDDDENNRHRRHQHQRQETKGGRSNAHAETSAEELKRVNSAPPISDHKVAVEKGMRDNYWIKELVAVVQFSAGWVGGGGRENYFLGNPIMTGNGNYGSCYVRNNY